MYAQELKPLMPQQSFIHTNRTKKRECLLAPTAFSNIATIHTYTYVYILCILREGSHAEASYSSLILLWPSCFFHLRPGATETAAPEFRLAKLRSNARSIMGWTSTPQNTKSQMASSPQLPYAILPRLAMNGRIAHNQIDHKNSKDKLQKTFFGHPWMPQ